MQNRKKAASEKQEKVIDDDSQAKGKKKILVPYIGEQGDPNIDDFMNDNAYMMTGFRIGFHTYRQAARSIFMIHNETMDIWTHMIGSITFICVVFYVIFYLQPVNLQDNTLVS